MAAATGSQNNQQKKPTKEEMDNTLNTLRKDGWRMVGWCTLTNGFGGILAYRDEVESKKIKLIYCGDLSANVIKENGEGDPSYPRITAFVSSKEDDQKKFSDMMNGEEIVWWSTEKGYNGIALQCNASPLGLTTLDRYKDLNIVIEAPQIQVLDLGYIQNEQFVPFNQSCIQKAFGQASLYVKNFNLNNKEEAIFKRFNDVENVLNNSYTSWKTNIALKILRKEISPKQFLGKGSALYLFKNQLNIEGQGGLLSEYEQLENQAAKIINNYKEIEFLIMGYFLDQKIGRQTNMESKINEMATTAAGNRTIGWNGYKDIEDKLMNANVYQRFLINSALKNRRDGALDISNSSQVYLKLDQSDPRKLILSYKPGEIEICRRFDRETMRPESIIEIRKYDKLNNQLKESYNYKLAPYIRVYPNGHDPSSVRLFDKRTDGIPDIAPNNEVKRVGIVLTNIGNLEEEIKKYDNEHNENVIKLEGSVTTVEKGTERKKSSNNLLGQYSYGNSYYNNNKHYISNTAKLHKSNYYFSSLSNKKRCR